MLHKKDAQMNFKLSKLKKEFLFIGGILENLGQLDLNVQIQIKYLGMINLIYGHVS